MLLVSPGCQLGNNTPKIFVYVLIGDKIGKNFAIPDHGCRSIVAG